MRNLLLFGTILFTLAVSMHTGMKRHKAAAAAEERAVTVGPVPQTPVPAQTQAAAELPESATAPVYAEERLVVPQLPLSSVDVPQIGRIQVLNGTNIDGAGKRMFDFLREKRFDVKGRPENAPSRNYPATMVISRTSDMSTAKEVEKVLRTGKVVLMRNNDPLHDVTVIVGWDFEEIAKRERIK
ncbi:MAG: LytR C-terminal domain-containing protein [Chitinispirillia bacterium]|nr:LytR C-terminal domain-containing protein [Chitinispirillia bacterium]MCL2241542.1 LytR C-terminal domain-containing protein [Chitinispirillia bacterium]